MDVAQSALDSLRTVEFRETLKGYHRDDVDEYLEKAAVEAEGLQEQFRQANDRLRQANERIAQLEAALEHQPDPGTGPVSAPAVGDETLQRTLMLAQQFVDQTKADSEARASKTLADAEERARALTAEAESRAAQIASESDRKLREEVGRLEAAKAQLSGDVEKMARHLDNERNRLRSALTEVIKWVDDNVQPASALSSSQRTSEGSGSSSRPTPPTAPAAARPQPAQQTGRPAGGTSTGAGDTGSVRTGEAVIQTLDNGSTRPPHA